MISKNYKKVAIIDYKSQPIPLSKGLVKWKLAFKPKQIIVCVSNFADNLLENNTFNIIPNPVSDSTRELKWVRPTSQDCWDGTIKTFDENILSWREDNIFGSVNTNLVGITYVIAIG